MNEYGNKQENSRRYTVNPFCPICGEEHCYYDVKLTETEESTLRDYYRDKIDLTGLALSIEEMANPPLIIKRKAVIGLEVIIWMGADGNDLFHSRYAFWT